MLDVSGPSPLLTCGWGWILPFILGFLLILIGKKKKLVSQNKIPFMLSFFLALVLISIGIFFTFINALMIDKYWYLYDYSQQFLLQAIIFQLVIIPIGFTLSYIIIKRINQSKPQIICSILLSIFLILASITTSLLINAMQVNLKDHKYRYELEFKTSPNNSYILYCPVIYSDDQSDTILNHMVISDNCQIEFIVTEFGNALKIDGKGNIEVKFNYVGQEHFGWTSNLYYGYNDSAPGGERMEYSIYYNTSNNESASIIIDWAYLGIGSDEHIHLEGELKNTGWQLIGGDQKHVSD